MTTRRVVLYWLAAMICVGCGDQIVNTRSYQESSVIAGTVSPPDSGIVIATGASTYQTAIAEDGTFRIADVEPGVYRLRIEPLHYSPREPRPVVPVGAGQNVFLSDIPLSHQPFPIYEVTPADGAVSVGIASYYDPIRLKSDRRLNLNDLNSMTTIEPATVGEWVESEWRDEFHYFYRERRTDDPERSYLRTHGTVYTVHVDHRVRMDNGIQLDRAIAWSFRTAPVEVRIELPKDDILPGQAMEGLTISIAFNCCIDVDAIPVAVTLDPPIPGRWMRGGVCDAGGSRSRQFTFIQAPSPLPPQTAYTITVRDDIALFGDISLQQPVRREFVTEPYGIIRISPANGTVAWPPNRNVDLEFNTAMDTASVTAAFSIQSEAGVTATGEYYWWPGDRKMAFKPIPTLEPFQSYRILLTCAAQTAEGVPLSQEFESFFTVR